MADKIFIERLEFQGRCGITADERRQPQPMAVDLELDCETTSAAASERLSDTIDYAQVAGRIVEIGDKEVCTLLEALAEKMLTVLFTDFHISRARLWLRKLAPPMTQRAGSSVRFPPCSASRGTIVAPCRRPSWHTLHLLMSTTDRRADAVASIAYSRTAPRIGMLA